MWQLNILSFDINEDCYKVYRHIGTFETNTCISVANKIVERYVDTDPSDKNKWQILNGNNNYVDIADFVTKDNIISKIFYKFESGYKLEIWSCELNPDVDIDDIIHILF